MTATPPDGPGGERQRDSDIAAPAGAARDAEAFARRALQWDAAYCAVAGIAFAAFASAIEQHLEVSAWVVATTGVAAVAWAGFLGWLAGHELWRRSTAVAGTANALATATIGYWAVVRGGSTGILLALLALQVAGFGVAQAWALADR